MPWDWPVEVNCFEAYAYCRWLTRTSGTAYRLPTEDEYYGMLKHTDFDYKQVKNNIALRYTSPTPIDKHQNKGIYDPMGNVWQWTRTPMYPFKGFEVHPIYDDFTMPTFDDKHNMIKGGSWISTGNLAIPHSRYAFRRHFFQHAGFRPVIPSNQEFWLKEENLMSDHEPKNVVT
jgi:formylglycine-generating enzyme required for sulfatase activity